MTFLDKARLLQTSVLGGLIFAAAPAFAQVQTSTDDEDGAVVQVPAADEEFVDVDEDVVVVTGSRLQRNSFTSVSPLQVVDGETARNLGIVDAQEILGNTTVVSGQQNTVGLSTAFNAGLQQAFTTIGSATPSLRGLGSSVTGRTRSLVLVNGRRLGPIGVGGQPANPDVSMIPGSLIERTELLLDGASSVYGSDAVGGVINYIMRSDFDGVEVSAQNSISQHGWGHQQVYSLTTGVSNDRGFIGIAAEYNKTDEILIGDILTDLYDPVQGVYCNASIGVDLDGSVREVCDDTPAGFVITGAFGTVIPTNPGGLTEVGNSGFFARPGSFFTPVNDPTIVAFEQNMNQSFSPEVKRTSMFVNSEYNLGAGVDVFFEGMFSNRQLENSSVSQEILPVGAQNPFNPFGSGALFVHAIQDTIAQEINVARYTTGLKGDFGFTGDMFGGFLSDWTYEASMTFHRSNGVQTRDGLFQEDRLTAGLNSSVDPVTGLITCSTPSGDNFFGFDQNRSPIACVPLNPFVASFAQIGRFATDAENDFATGNSMVSTEVEQTIGTAFVQGDLFKIPTGGSARLLLGVEGRRDQTNSTTSDNLRLGLIQGLDADAGASGDRWVREAFGELSLPLVEGRKGIKSLLVEGAMRYTDEEFSGSDVTYQIRGEYAPVDWVTFKAGYGTSFRTPDVGELFGTGTVFVQPSRIDPCVVGSLQINPNTNLYDPNLETRSQTVLDNCLALGLDPTTLGTVGQGTGALAFISLPVAFGNFGGRNLGPETSDAMFAGFTVEQPWFESFDASLAVTYYEYEIVGSIGQLTRGQILNDCFASVGLTDPLCAFQTRDASGTLTAVNEASFNLGAVTSRGYDVNLRVGYDFDMLNLDDSIRLDWNLLMTQSLENAEDLLNDGTITDNLGRLRLGGGFPDYQVLSTVQANYKDFGMIWRLRYLSDLFGTPDLGNSFDPCFDFNTGALDPVCTEKEFTDHSIVNDLFFVYNNDNWTFRAGINNVFNEIQKIDEDLGVANAPIGAGFDTLGRRFTVALQRRF